MSIDVSQLRAPGSGEALALAGPSLVQTRQGSFAVVEVGSESFIDFVTGASLREAVSTQQQLYDDQRSMYAQQLAADGAFIERFVDEFVADHTKNKAAVLRRELLALGLGAASLAVEIGCNDGRYLNALSAMTGCRGLGFDVSTVAIARAVQVRPRGLRTAFHAAQAEALPLATGSVDAIISFDVFEHLGHAGVRRTLSECQRVLTARGRLVIYVVSRQDRYTLHETFRTVSNGAVGVDAGEGHEYENFVSPDELRRYAREASLRVVRLEAYHGFWTLFAEEQLANRLPKWAYPWLHLLDFPLIRAEHGNGFLAVLERAT
ncbi:MAG: methyltransferase domain-containing protein [Myxococcales bacterium]|nr:methyltransferase domain-containing protein [Myxococcales bacterium]